MAHDQSYFQEGICTPITPMLPKLTQADRKAVGVVASLVFIDFNCDYFQYNVRFSGYFVPFVWCSRRRTLLGTFHPV